MSRGWRPTRHDILGVPVDDLTLDETLDYVDELIATRQPHQQVSVNVFKLVAAHEDPGLRELIASADVVNADGQPVVWAARLLGVPLRERVAGVDLMTALIQRAQERGYRLYFLGARPEVVEEVVQRVRANRPNVEIAGWRNGYWSLEQEPEVVGTIASARPDILFVALGTPAKELFLAKWKHALGVPFAMGVGGSFDVYAGVTKRAPPAFQRLGLEWVVRLMQEPRRLFRRYATDAPRFVWLVVKGLREKK